MAEASDFGPVVRLPERVDRRSRLGPFPSAQDAAKFLCYAAAGALVAPWVGPLLWLPLVGVGFGVSVWQPDGRPVDERAFTYLRWKVRSFSGRLGMTHRKDSVTRHGVVQLAPSCYVAVVRASGYPIAYLPPRELAQKFEQYRDVLRTLAGDFAILSTTVPIRAAPVLPAGRDAPGMEGDALRGYRELTELLCHRRRVRRVYVAVRNSESGPDTLARLEVQVSSLTERLRGLGLYSVRLQDRALREASHRFGWAPVESLP
jgi:hypothetical protein